MEDDIPMKRRKINRLNDSFEVIGTRPAGNLDVSPLAVKVDKFQKLRKIAASCEKIQNTKNDDIIISSVGSSPSASPDILTSLSTPVDPAELKERLTALVNEEDIFVGAPSESGAASHLQAASEEQGMGGGQQRKPQDVPSPTLDDVEGKTFQGFGAAAADENKASAAKVVDISFESAEFKALVKCLINEKMKKLDESYCQSVIPTLEKKISHLENENKYLHDRVVLLQNNLHKVLADYHKHIQKPLQNSIGIQVDQVPPPLVATGTTVAPLPGKPAPNADYAPGLHKPPLTLNQMPPKVQPGHYEMQGAVTQAVSFKQRLPNAFADVIYGANMTTASIGSMYTTNCYQPRLYSDANHKPGVHPNAVAGPRTYTTTFVRPSGPVTATVYPQPQNHHVITSDLGVPRGPAPSSRNPEQSPPSGYVYTQQTPNGVVIQTSTRPQLGANPPTRPQLVANPPTRPQLVANPPTQPMSYTGNPERRGHVLSHQSTLSPRITVSRAQMPQPDHQATAGRAQPQKSYQPSPVNSIQMNSMQHYVARPGGPPSPRTVLVQTAGIPGAPRQMIAQNPMAPRAQAPYARPSGPPPLVRAQPQQPQQQQQQQHIVQNSSPRFQGALQTNSMVPRAHGPPNIRTMNPLMAQVQGGQARVQSSSQGGTIPVRLQGHPLPGVASNGPHVPTQPSPTLKSPATELPPPPPNVSISSVSNGIVLSWNMTIPEGCAPIDSYQLFAYQNNGHLPHSPSLWKKLGIVKALPLPMACTLTQFVSGSVYHFAVRAIDVHGRAGSYSPPCSITLPAENGKSCAI